MPFDSCRQNAGFNTISPVLVPAGRVWLNHRTAPPAVCAPIHHQQRDHTTPGGGRCRRRFEGTRKLPEQEVTSRTDCSKMADAEPPSWSIFVVCVLVVVCACAVVCCLLVFVPDRTDWTDVAFDFIHYFFSRNLARSRLLDNVRLVCCCGKKYE